MFNIAPILHLTCQYLSMIHVLTPGGGVLRKIFDRGVWLQFSTGYPWLRKFWLKTHPWLRRISWSWAHFCMILIPPLHRGCDLCASLVRPQNCPGRRWRQKGGRTVALVVQGWYTGRSGIAMDAMVAVKFWACSKQSHKGRRGGRSLTGRSKEAGWRHTHRRGRRMDAQWSAIGRPVKNANIVYQFERLVCLPCTTIVPPLDDQWRPLSDHCGDHCASIQRPRQHLSHHGDGSAFTLPSLRDLLCHYNSFGRSRKAQGSCCSSYTETELSGFRRPLSVLTIFMVAQGWHEGRSPV